MSLRDKMLAVMTDVNADVAEREELVELIAIALLTRKNLFILGDPGQAKSYAVTSFCKRVTGARKFERLLSKQTDEEQLFGRLDLSSLLPNAVSESLLKDDGVYQNLRFDLQVMVNGLTAQKNTPEVFTALEKATQKLTTYRSAVAALHANEPVVQTTGKLPEADICFLDEIFKCNDGVLNSLLTALNERKYTNEGCTYSIPTISFFAASNEIPNFNNPEEKILSALYDRLELKIVTENISERQNRLAVLKRKQAGQFGDVRASITLEELNAMQQEVASIGVPDAINELADDILCELRKQVPVSDRKYLGFYPIAQAKAWLEGHTQVEPSDLLALKNYLWQVPSDQAFVEAILQRMCINPMQDKINDILAMAKDAQVDFQAACTDTSKPGNGRKALIKLRGELIRLYQMQVKLAGDAQSDSETQLAASLLDDLEKISRSAHEAIGFTHAPLEQLAALQ